MSDTRVVDLPDLDFLTDEPETLHRYPRDRRYRLSGMSPPQPGDIACCGHVKQKPGNSALAHREATCVRCVRLARMAGAE